ncbi:MAG TPA: hypothetical protein VGP93_16890, partial [Polyangiaceae bacterium]|nr:hypothetical protein [Polyangiaceae bacterium]
MLMWNSSKALGLVALFGLSWALLGGCSSKGDDDDTNGSAGDSGGGKGPAPGKGICQSSCAKSCDGDSDCDTSSGELCCSLGSAGKICAPASQCPRFCSDDVKCDTKAGEACVSVDLSYPNLCSQPESALQLCGSDDECKSSDICCTIYDKPFCLPPSQCPQACSASSECDTNRNEVCCTTVGKIEPHLTVDGLCLNPSYEKCPKACSVSTDCKTSSGELCCNGVCSLTCPKECSSSADCTTADARICCKSAEVRAPELTHKFTTGPHCAGTPSYSTCELFSQQLGKCATVDGCELDPSGSCVGTPS